MKAFIKIFLSLCIFLFSGNAALYAHSCSIDDGFTLTKSLPKLELSTIPFASTHSETNAKFDERKPIENSDKSCLLEFEEEQDDEKSSKKQIALFARPLTIYAHQHLALSCTEKEYLNSFECYCYFSTQRYITFRTIRI